MDAVFFLYTDNKKTNYKTLAQPNSQI